MDSEYIMFGKRASVEGAKIDLKDFSGKMVELQVVYSNDAPMADSWYGLSDYANLVGRIEEQGANYRFHHWSGPCIDNLPVAIGSGRIITHGTIDKDFTNVRIREIKPAA